jgi:isoleucyl-tRNA synthetase
MFRQVPKDLNIPQFEEKVLDFWKKKKIFQKSIQLRKKSPEFIFYEGPPTANGKPGIHHVMSRTVKDIVCRYKSMKGFLVRRKAGWDTHGLPVEIEVEKELKINGKDEIEKYGIDKFNKKCRESVFHYKKEWDNLTERIGYWLDLENPYITFTNEYIESVWWILKEFWKKDLLYQGFKILPYCPRCETPVSSHEVSQGYRDVKDPSIYVRMEIKGKKNGYFLVWTTTPWTLISNVALAVNPEIEYCEIAVDDILYIMAKERIGDLFQPGSYQVLRGMKGSKLQGMEYKRLFDFLPVDKKAFYVIPGSFVTTDDGTGIVHIAPGFGEDDYHAGLQYNLPILRPVDAKGRFESVVTDYQGQFVKDADEKIISDLKNKGSLFKKMTIEHNYPHCWRCHTPLLYYARECWYIRTSEYKNDLLANNDKINWHPEEVGSGRFGEWLKNNIDWSLSRDRYWGTPLNIWICDTCKENLAIGSITELKEKGEHIPRDLDLHKPFVDGITVKCDKCGGIMYRVPEVIDCWFDSGSMPYAQYHYPFENEENFKKNFPADFICEGIDQTRGWFYSLLAISTLLFNKPAFKNIVVNELILDKNGQKMSKSRGNAVVPEEIISKYGADPIRWYLMTTSPPWTPKRFDEEGIKEVLRKFINTLINSYSFFVLYANIDKYNGGESKISVLSRSEIDRWILSKLYDITGQVNTMMNGYELTKAARLLSDFIINDISNWYIRRNRRRFWKSGDSNDKLAAYQTLHELLLILAKLMAPFVPLLAEEIYTNIKDKNDPESVHLCDYPTVTDEQRSFRDEPLEERMNLAQEVVSLCLSLRNDNKIKVRQPLNKVLVYVKKESDKHALLQMASMICDELNVKQIQAVNNSDEIVVKNIKPNFKILGPKAGKLMGKLVPIITAFSAEQINNLEKNGFERIVIDGLELKVTREDVEILISPKEGLAVSCENNLLVALDLVLNQELINEGIARELVNRIQNIRKEVNFKVTDRIEIYYQTNSERIIQAIQAKSDYIMNETLTINFLSRRENDLFLREIAIEDDVIQIGIKKKTKNQEGRYND